jgi:hypothetical protein
LVLEEILQHMVLVSMVIMKVLRVLDSVLMEKLLLVRQDMVELFLMVIMEPLRVRHMNKLVEIINVE